MSNNEKIDIAFLWHMHQPFYKDTATGRYLMPWVRLRGVKDYFPMAKLVERFDGVKVTFNLVPVLVEQINDYVRNKATDTLLDLTMKRASALTPSEKLDILEHFFKVNFKRFIETNTRYSELLLKKGIKPVSGTALKNVLASFSDQDFLDLQVLFNMSWFHSISIDEDANLKELKAKRSYTEEDKEFIIYKQREIMGQILPLYKRLEDEGKIEITTTPYYHPILPLLCDNFVARTSSHGMSLPRKKFSHPEDAKWHIDAAVKYHHEQFGRMPRGMWPSEGSVSDAMVDLAISSGIKWVATDEDILFRSLSTYDKKYKGVTCFDRRVIYQPYKVKRGSKHLTMIFRDKNLSDMISFNYNAWNPADAARDLLGHFKNISQNMRRDTDRGIVTIVMDGENAWEYYEDNGRLFFETLYAGLENDEDVRSSTISGFLESEPPRKALSSIFPASWINHNFEVWIGQEQDNASWEYLASVRSDLVKFTKRSEKGASGDAGPDISMAWRELYIAEGSDWNWWYAGKLHSGAANPFDGLYRMHLKNIYKILKKPVPDFLKISIA